MYTKFDLGDSIVYNSHQEVVYERWVSFLRVCRKVHEQKFYMCIIACVYSLIARRHSMWYTKVTSDLGPETRL